MHHQASSNNINEESMVDTPLLTGWTRIGWLQIKYLILNQSAAKHFLIFDLLTSKPTMIYTKT